MGLPLLGWSLCTGKAIISSLSRDSIGVFWVIFCPLRIRIRDRIFRSVSVPFFFSTMHFYACAQKDVLAPCVRGPCFQSVKKMSPVLFFRGLTETRTVNYIDFPGKTLKYQRRYCSVSRKHGIMDPRVYRSGIP